MAPGTGTTVWKFYDAVNHILGNKPATRPPFVIDTSVESVQSQVTHIRNGSEEFENSSSPGVSETEYEGDESSFVEIESGTTNDSDEKKKEIKLEIKSKRKLARKISMKELFPFLREYYLIAKILMYVSLN